MAALFAAAGLSACVCSPTDDACEVETEEELIVAGGHVTVDGTRRSGVWVISSRNDSVRSDFNGEFRLEVPRSGTRTFRARAPAGTAFVRAVQDVDITRPTEVHFEGYSLASISGHVRYRGQPVAAVLVATGPVTRADTTGAAGDYRFAGLATEPVIGYTLRISDGPPGIYNDSRSGLTLLGRDTVIDFEAQFIGGGYFRGRVSVGASGIAGVIVTATGPFAVADTTDVDGRYTLPTLPLGDYTVSISGFDAAAYAFVDTTRQSTLAVGPTVMDFVATPITPNQPPTAVITQPAEGATFTAGTAIPLQGSATDPEDGPLTGASLVWTVNAGGAAVGTGENATLATLSAGSYRIWLTATDAQGLSGTASVLITVAPGPSTGSISGRVTANGYGVGDVLVTLSGPINASAVTDANASYAFASLPPGTYTISISGYPSAVSFPATSQTVTLAVGQNVTANFAGSY